LSESPSPPPFWGIPDADGAELDSGAELLVEVVAGADLVALEEPVELEELEPPHPAATSAIATVSRAARRGLILRAACPDVGGVICGLLGSC